MKKTTFLGLALITIGIFAIFYHSEASVITFFSSETTEIHEKETIDGAKIKSIDIQSSSPNVYLIPSDEEKITVELKGKVSEELKDSYSLDVDTAGDTLEVKADRDGNTFWALFGVIHMDTDLEVHIPEKMYEFINISTSSGEISIDNFRAKNIDLHVSSGDVNASNLLVDDELRLVSSSGGLEVLDSQANSVSASASSGSIKLDNFVAKTINLAASSGTIKLTNTEGEISAAASSGNIYLNNKQLNANITASTSSGRVEMNFHEIPSAIVDFKGSSGDGDVTIPDMSFEENSSDHIYGKVGSGDYKIKVRTSSGDFELGI